MDDEKAHAYAELAAKMTELHASIALLAHNVDKMARTDAEVTSMTKIFQGVCVLWRGRGLACRGTRVTRTHSTFLCVCSYISAQLQERGRALQVSRVRGTFTTMCGVGGSINCVCQVAREPSMKGPRRALFCPLVRSSPPSRHRMLENAQNCSVEGSGTDRSSTFGSLGA